MARRFSFASFAIAMSLVATAPLFAASPRLSNITPRGIQRGAEHVISFNGSNLADAQEIFFYDKGFEVTKVEPSGGSVKVTVKVAADCRLGEHVAQVRTASGISDYRSKGGIWDRFQPVTIQEFLASEDKRKLYWQRKRELLHQMGAARPNAAHLAIAQLDRIPN